MIMENRVAPRLQTMLERLLGAEIPLRLRGWDGSEAGPDGVPAVVFRDRRALRRLLWQPNELGLARAYVAGEIDVQGDLYDALRRIYAALDPGSVEPANGEQTVRPPAPAGRATRAAIALDLMRLRAIGREPAPPPEEVTLRGVRHGLRRDRQAISHHYDVGNDFYRLVLGESMVYSCAYWTSTEHGYGLADAQRDKLELICRKLALEPGMRLLDVGCGWGSLAMHAAEHHGVNVVGVTISQHQAGYARKWAAQAGLTDRVDIRLQDYREVDDGPFDAISSVGMAEHVGVDQYARYAAQLHRLLRPGGRLLNHQIAGVPPRGATGPARTPAPRSFISAYVFPDGELAPLATTVDLLEQAGFEVRDVEALREHYARTLRAWVRNLEADWNRAVGLTSLGRARVWRLFMAGSALSFEAGRLGVNQILAVRPHPDGRSDLPATRTWLSDPPAGHGRIVDR